MVVKDYMAAREQIFICFDKQGYICRFKPKNPLEKQIMYSTYYMYLQVGLKPKYSLKVRFKDGSDRSLSPEYLSNLKLGKREFFSKKKVETIWVD